MTLEPCALNAEFQHFILRFNKIPNFANTTKRGDRGRKQAQRHGEDRMTLQITYYCSYNFKYIFNFD